VASIGVSNIKNIYFDNRCGNLFTSGHYKKEKIHTSIHFFGLTLSDFAKNKLSVTGKELQEEKDEALSVLDSSVSNL